MNLLVCALYIIAGTTYIKNCTSFLRKPSNSQYRRALPLKHSLEGQSLRDLFAEEYELALGGFKIKSVLKEQASTDIKTYEASEGLPVILLQDTGAGWGSGEHPTTKLCLEFLHDTVKEGDKVLDYGAGSGVLSIFSIRALGAKSSVAVDIDEASLLACETNARINGCAHAIDSVHTRMVYLGEERFPQADVTVANILPGPLTRLVAPIVGFTRPGGWLCLSGMRPGELAAVRAVYAPYIDAETEQVCTADHIAFGQWVSWRARMRVLSQREMAAMVSRLSTTAME
jgi:ribosomal protein L11 methylase PrmA